MILTLDAVNCFYGRVQVLRDLSLRVAPGEVLCLLGRNGAGKTTTLKTIMGLIKPRSGRVCLGDVDLGGLPAHEIPRRGIAYVPQGRRLFAELTVEENLTIGLMTRDRGASVRERGLTKLALVGLATDFCVAYSALDAARLGFDTTVLLDACRAIDLNGSLATARRQMQLAGVSLGEAARLVA
jgi:ABC-type multidrug transport system ATPase subunit